MEGSGAPFFAIFIHIPVDVAWFAVSQALNAAPVSNRMVGREEGEDDELTEGFASLECDTATVGMEGGAIVAGV